VVVLFAIQHGYCDAVPPQQTGDHLAGALAHVRAAAPEALREIGATKQLTAAAERGIEAALQQYVTQLAGSSVSSA
jgi:F0F1-type ATP synthase alpha subunit